MNWNCLFILLLLTWTLIDSTLYSNKWAAKIEGGEAKAREISEKHGFRILGKVFIRLLKNYFFF